MLRPYQTAAVSDLRRSIASGHRAPILVAPTGSGKTVVAAELVRSALAKGKRVLFLAPRRELILQCSRKLFDAGIEHGVVMAGIDGKPWERVQVGCIPTLHARRERVKLPQAELVIIDEAHLAVAETTLAVMRAYPAAVKVGLTATPARADGRALGIAFDDLVLGPSVAELTAQGHLVPVRYFAPSKPDLAGIKITAGDYNRGELGTRMDNAKLVGDVVTNWARICPQRKTVAFCVNIAHSLHLREAFAAIGIAAEHLDGATPNTERAAILARFESGDAQVLTSCDVLTYGWDSPPAACAIMARPTKSVVRFLQMAGRVLRPYPGKENCIVLDHAGLIDEMGFVDEERAWTLAGSERLTAKPAAEKKLEERTMTCKGCAAVFNPRRYCPECGHDNGERHAKAVKTVEADLLEVERDKRRKANRVWSAGEKERFYGELKSICRQRNYNSHWADNQYRARIGVWPNAYKHTALREPSPETLAWIRHKQIAYAKRVSA